MIHGHGDDLYKYPSVWANFSSNVYCEAEHPELIAHLQRRLPELVGSYPEPEPNKLQQALAEHLGYSPEQVLVTNGATEAIYLLAHLTSGQATHIAQPTFSEYADATALYACPQVPSSSSAQVLWCCNPNNPTGSIIEEQTLQAEGLIIIDRSYQSFARTPLPQPTAQELERGNRLYIHSLTKRYRIPGLRLGYVLGSSQWIKQLKAQRQPWSVNALAIEAGQWLVSQGFPEVINHRELWAECDRLMQAIASLEGYHVHPTQTHFFLVRTPHKAQDLKNYLAQSCGLLVRDASNFEGLTPYHIRIATQSPQANDALINALKTCPL